jgi:hypothetical protein
MNIFHCTCGQSLFFENSRCLSCGAETGFCPACRRVTALQPDTEAGMYRCGYPDCGVRLVKCANYADYDICNWCVRVPDEGPPPGRYCDCCRYTVTIPDLSVPGNLHKWFRLESAKRRLFYELDLLGLPYGTAADGFNPPLSFDFKADTPTDETLCYTMGEQEQVYTGHRNGQITINIREADEVERERIRIDMGEAHRTLIGHFRHEIAHYFWESLVAGHREGAFATLFGNPHTPDYAAALEQYYRYGPVPDWPSRFISAYASMHPWEDWAETFAMYLDMTSTLDTAAHAGFLSTNAIEPDDLMTMITAYQRLGIGLNEISRTMGLIDMVPDIPVPPVIEKLRFIHAICRQAGQTNKK